MKIIFIWPLLVLLLFTNVINADAKISHQNHNFIKNHLLELKPTEDKTVTITMISKLRTMHVWYVVQVQTCAGNEKLYSPDITISSDKDSVDVTVWGLIMPNTCKTNEFFMRANDPNSIIVFFSKPNYGEPQR